MNRSVVLAALAWCSALRLLHAGPAEAEAPREEYQHAMDKWALEMRIATTPDAKAKAFGTRPDATPYARRVWAAIKSSLSEDWTLESAGWFLKITPGLLASTDSGIPKPIFDAETNALLTAIAANHLKSAKLMPVCTALVVAKQPKALATLEKIAQQNPDARIQGTAAMAAAVQLKALGDDVDVMKKRLNYIRDAITKSADVKIDDTTVGDVARDETYIIKYLTKGRVAPDLAGTDVAGKALSLSANKGKVIVLLFWNSNTPDSKQVIEMTNNLNRRLAGKPFAVIGVNNDPVEKLRDLHADGTVTWQDFSDPDNKLAHDYRVGNRPLVYVLDGERKIHFIGGPGSFVDLTVEALLAPPEAPKK